MKRPFALALVLFFALSPSLRAAEPLAADPVLQHGMEARHRAKVAELKQKRFGLLVIGDSITQNLEKPAFKAVWETFFAPRNAINLGYSGARTENILWNLQNGEMENQAPRVIPLLIGTNNLSGTPRARASTPGEIAGGIRQIILRLRARSPETRILLMGVFPRGASAADPYRAQIADLNAILAREWSSVPGVVFSDIGKEFLDAGGGLPRDMMSDGVHPTDKGYALWAREILRVFQEQGP